MKTLMFRSKGLWSIVKDGFSEEGQKKVVEERRMKDASALYLIQQGLDEKNPHLYCTSTYCWPSLENTRNGVSWELDDPLREAMFSWSRT